MISIDNAWEVPLSRGGIYKIVVNDDNLEVYRIFSGRYIQEKLQLKKDMDYIDSLIVPGATDYIEPEQLYSDIKHMIEVITERYFSIEQQAEAVFDVVHCLGINKFSIAGNSYGGWIAMKLASTIAEPDMLFLVDSAGISPALSEESKETMNRILDSILRAKKNLRLQSGISMIRFPILQWNWKI